ncbi:MAG: hypothetical protein QG577_2364 [Thermodesulfobacteriota bacterium]|nr:hypothetical protein [Thermodesulfobacteriota bacterium]
MGKRVVGILLVAAMTFTGTLVLAGGAAAPAYPQAACGPGGYAMGGNPCAYWGDAPFPGMCGGVVALPFLVVGSLLGGNTVGPYPPIPGPNYVAAVRPARAYVGPPAYAAAGMPYGGNSIFSGNPVFDLGSNLLGSFTGGLGLGF